MSKRYGNGPENKHNFIRRFDAFYTRFAPVYDQFVKRFPIWKTWLKHALPYLQGQRVLEISFGTGYLLTQYAHRFDTYGIDYNHKMALVASSNLKQAKKVAHLQTANVDALPYPGESFDSLVNTLAFSGRVAGGDILRDMAPLFNQAGFDHIDRESGGFGSVHLYAASKRNA